MALRAIVTGASRRVGREIALTLASRGVSLVLTGRSRNSDLEKTRGMVDSISRRSAAESDPAAPARIELLELSDPESLRAFVTAIGSEPLDVLVLNASSYSRSGARAPDASSTDQERGAPRDLSASVSTAIEAARDAEAHFRVNAASALALSLGLATALAQSTRPGGGAIVVLGDMHTEGRPVRGFAPYLMSKAALGQMVESLAVELAPRVRVNAVLPGVVAWPESETDAVRQSYEEKIPLGRSGTPGDAASAVAWLALDAPYVTGVQIRVDGGRWLR